MSLQIFPILKWNSRQKNYGVCPKFSPTGIHEMYMSKVCVFKDYKTFVSKSVSTVQL